MVALKFLLLYFQKKRVSLLVDMSHPHIYVHMLVWNDRRYLPDVFATLESQTCRADMTIRLLDNGSTDDSLVFIREKMPQSLVARNGKNLGFAEGHNQLVRFTLDHLVTDEEAYILIMNPDMILKETVVEELARVLTEHPDVAAVQPKLYRAFRDETSEDVTPDATQSDIIDTTGMRVSASWRMTDRGAGELDTGQYDTQTDIFAPTGTMMMIRASAVRDLLIDQDLYDRDFFTYREDCDFAWRFARAGFHALFVPTAIAWHYRGMAGIEKQSWMQRLFNRRTQRPFFAALATRNQLFVLLRNLTLLGFLKAFPRILFHEGGRVLYGFFFEKETRARLLGMWRYLPRQWRCRKLIQAQARVSESLLKQVYVG